MPTRVNLVLCVALSMTVLSEAEEPPAHITLPVANSGTSLHFIRIAPGTFTMGRDVRIKEAVGTALGHFEVGPSLDEGPERVVKVERGYYIMDGKVTTLAFCEFLNDIAPERADEMVVLNDFSRIERIDNRYQPKERTAGCGANTVTWEGARAFCNWISERTGRRIRLPTEEEWEFAARGQESRRHPWGNDARPLTLIRGGGDVTNDCAEELNDKLATPNGLRGMVGPVGEWVTGPYGGDDARLLHSHVLRRSLHGWATEREPATEVRDSGIFGFRVVMEPE